MAKLKLLPNECEINKVNANYGAYGGKLYLTNKRVVFVSKMGQEVYVAYFKNIQAHNVQQKMGAYANINITQADTTDSFVAFKKSAFYFDELLTDIIFKDRWLQAKNDAAITDDNYRKTEEYHSETELRNKDELDSSVRTMNSKKTNSGMSRFLIVGIIISVIIASLGIIGFFYEADDSSDYYVDKEEKEIDPDEIAELYFKGGHIGSESEIGCVRVYVGFDSNYEPLDVAICEECGWIGDTDSASLHNASHDDEDYNDSDDYEDDYDEYDYDEYDY